MEIPESLNDQYIDAQYRRWKQDPDSVSRDWQFFFKGFDLAGTGAAPGEDETPEARSPKQARVEALVYRYRNIGHLLACMDPLSACPTEHPLLDLDQFDLTIEDLAREFTRRSPSGDQTVPLKEIIQSLKETYCRSVAVEYMHLQDPTEREWLMQKMEPTRNRPDLKSREKKGILKDLIRSARFEAFLNKKYVGVTRFSLEGGDALIPLLHALFDRSAQGGCREVILGMAHRGRLNVQANVLERPLEEIFSEFESCYEPDQLLGAGDVKYHNGYLNRLELAEGRRMQVVLVNNPSHLEAVNPVVEGMARARIDLAGGDILSVMPVLIHGDAAFAGQGVVAETLNMSQLAGYKTGGTVHIIINNQIGYTTLPEDARSTRYSTDVAKMLMVPIFHVHGEDPDAVVQAARLAAAYRRKFAKDVVIDLVCYRRYGHNEGDEPYFTQPTMYARIRKRPTLDKIYAESLTGQQLVSAEEIAAMEEEVQQALEGTFDEVHNSACPFPENRYFPEWDGIQAQYSHQPVRTQVGKAEITRLAKNLSRLPKGFSPHPRLKTLLDKRLQAVEAGSGIDWANAEALAFASLLTEGTPIRLSGQDVGRGTFSHRHSVLTDHKTGETHVPLNALGKKQAPFEVYNSLLAEFGVLGFEYGYSVTRPEVLTIWEAQFGDFVNNAQSVIDLFIASGESKWQRLSGLTLMLPHGWEGLGPEHSSARLERFLQLCAEDNIQVCNLTTPAQYFHLLRRQAKSEYRKPLVLMTPKSLLRHPMAVSKLAEMTRGTFKPVIDDDHKAVKSVKKVICCSGKIYYQLSQRRKELKNRQIALVRLEQFHPFPESEIKRLATKYKKVDRWQWVQEEPENMGAWQFIKPRLESATGKKVSYVGRKPSASPATGFPRIYKQQQEAISDEAIGILASPSVS